MPQQIPRSKGRRAKTNQAAQRLKGQGATQKEKKEKPVVGPFLLAFFLFVVVGSAFLQILKVFLDAEPSAAVEDGQ